MLRLLAGLLLTLPAVAAQPLAPASPPAPGPLSVDAALADGVQQAPRASVVAAIPFLGVRAAGVRLAYTSRPLAARDWTFPVGADVAVAWTRNPDLDLDGRFVIGGGIVQAVRRLSPSGVSFQSGLQVALGREQIDGEGQFVGGGRLDLGVVRYPAGSGFVGGAGVYGSRLFGSDLYPWDLGATVTVGVQF